MAIFYFNDINRVLYFLNDFDNLMDVWDLLGSPFEFLFCRAYLNIFGDEYNVGLDNQVRLLKEDLRKNKSSGVYQFIVVFGTKIIELKNKLRQSQQSQQTKQQQQFDSAQMYNILAQIMKHKIYLDARLVEKLKIEAIGLPSWLNEFEIYLISGKVLQIAQLCKKNGVQFSVIHNESDEIKKTVSYLAKIKNENGSEIVVMLVDLLHATW